MKEGSKSLLLKYTLEKWLHYCEIYTVSHSWVRPFFSPGGVWCFGLTLYKCSLTNTVSSVQFLKPQTK